MATLAPIPTEIAFISSTKLHGNSTRRILRRTFFLYIALVAFGLAPTLLALSPALQAAGAGLIIPGGGFLAVGGWWLAAFPLVLLLFVAAMGLWLFTGNLAAPLIVWGGAAAAAAGAAGTGSTSWGAYAAVAAGLLFVARTLVTNAGKVKKAAERRAARNRDLPEALARLAAVRESAPPLASRELSPLDLAGLRYLLDLTLQPLGSFEGFVRKDNFQPAALRYQLNHLQYTLAVAQCQYTPNFHGYMSAAQRFTIESLQFPEVCGYWKLESVWGNFRWNPDPVDTRDNIMLTGWSGQCLGTYAANTGDLRYGEPAALRFRPFKRSSDEFAHDHHDFVDSLLVNWKRAPLFLFPCEPNFVYAQCNLFGYAAVAAYDRAYGTRHLADIHQPFRSSFYEEFELPDGEIQPILSDLTGLSLIFKPTVTASVSTITLANVFDPALAERMYAFAREEEVRTNEAGELMLDLVPLDRMDPGNYSKSTIFCHAWLAASAQEMGDYETARLTLAAIERDNKRVDRDGVSVFEGVSVSTMSNYVLARILRRNFWRDTVVEGPPASALTGPLLGKCTYPEVLVARAWSPNGDDLDLILYNGRAAGVQQLGLERLEPGATYRIDGRNETFTADADGGASLAVMLDGRTEVRIRRL